MQEEPKSLREQVLVASLIFLASAIVVIIVLALIGPTIGNIYSSNLNGL